MDGRMSGDLGKQLVGCAIWIAVAAFALGAGAVALIGWLA